MMAGGFKFVDHMTDSIVEAWGSTLEEAFESAARGLNDTMVDVNKVLPEKEIKISADGQSLENLLFDWLDKIMLVLLTEYFVMSQFKVKISKDSQGYRLEATAKGEKLDLEKHRYKVEIKAVTYHEMEIVQDRNGARVRYLLDL